MNQPEVIEFDIDHRAAVLAAMRDISARERGGWINLQPAVDPDDLEGQDSAFFGIFSARGPEVPLCTWTPPGRGRRSEPVVSLGVQHGAGARVVPLLAEIGITVPAGWRVRQDQPRKGLVVTAPSDEDDDVVLVWLLQVGEAVCRGEHRRWVAAVHRPGR